MDMKLRRINAPENAGIERKTGAGAIFVWQDLLPAAKRILFQEDARVTNEQLHLESWAFAAPRRMIRPRGLVSQL